MLSYATNTSPNIPKKSVSCGDVIRACDDALQKAQGQIDLRDMEILKYDVMSKTQADQIAEKDRQLNAWYRSPWLYLGLGLAGGLYLGKR